MGLLVYSLPTFLFVLMFKLRFCSLPCLPYGFLPFASIAIGCDDMGAQTLFYDYVFGLQSFYLSAFLDINILMVLNLSHHIA